MNKILWCLILLSCGLAPVYAEDISVSASVDRNNVSLGESFQLTLNISGTQNVPAPGIDGGDNFDVSYRGPSTQVSIVNGRISSLINHIYSVTPLKAGRHVIGPVEVKIKGKTYSALPITIDVRKGNIPQKGAPPAAGGNDGSSLDDLIYLEISTDKEQVYINQETPVTIRLYFRNVSIQNIQYPVFKSEGFSKGKYAEPCQGQVTLGGVLFNMVEFKTVVYPVAAGGLTLGPAELNCDMLIKDQSRRRPRGFFDDDFFGDFFGRVQSRPMNLKSKPLQLTVKSLPAEDKPDKFSGAVGRYSFDFKVNPQQLKVGEPITLTMKIKGRGNIQAVTVPEIAGLEKFKVYPPQVKTDIAQDKVYIEGEKTFEQVLIPTEVWDKGAIPEVKFSYFDPETEKYQVIARGPAAITVIPAPEEGPVSLIGLPAEGQQAAVEEKFGKGIVYIKTAPGSFRRKAGYFYKSPVFSGIYLLPLLGLITAVTYQRRRDRLTRDVRYARRQRALTSARRNLAKSKKITAQGKHEEALETVFKTVQEYLGDRFNLPSAGITHQVIEEIPRGSVPEPVRGKIKSFFDLCDAARFAPSAEISGALKQAVTQANEIINGLEKGKKITRRIIW